MGDAKGLSIHELLLNKREPVEVPKEGWTPYASNLELSGFSEYMVVSKDRQEDEYVSEQGEIVKADHFLMHIFLKGFLGAVYVK